MMRTGIGWLLAGLWAVGCGASMGPPLERQAASTAAIRQARQAGAENDERSATHLHYAEEELENGRALMQRGDNRQAAIVLQRALVEAHIAQTLAGEPKAAPVPAQPTPVPAQPTVATPTAIGGGPPAPDSEAPADPLPPKAPSATSSLEGATKIVALASPPSAQASAEPKPENRAAQSNGNSSRADGEKRAHDVLERIALLGAATVSIDRRGTVLTIPADALFASDSATLAPGAHQKLDPVAEALRSAAGHSAVIEGHTHSEGDPAANQALSQRRADAVREYLVARGVPAAQLRAEGAGAKRPVADNGTRTGRARNARVELIVPDAEEK